jgi:uncharacterized membrane protein YqjE
LEPSSDTSREDDAADRGPIRGLFKSIATLFATIVAIAHTRLELLSTELQQEMHRVAGIVVWTLIAILSAGIGLFMGALVIIFVFWDTHRMLASVAVTAGFFGIAIAAGLVLRAKVRGKPPLLHDTLAELAKDRDNLMNRHR